jgi:hypothetical protein
MAIAQMPGDAHKRGGVGLANLRQLFGRGHHFDDAPVVQRQAVAGAQHHRLGQVEQKGQTANAGHRNAAPVTIVIIKDDCVGGFAGPGTGGTNGMGVSHGLARIEKGACRHSVTARESRAGASHSHTRLAQVRKASRWWARPASCDRWVGGGQ